ncbi:MAG: helix-turn-helix transcriptional regulator [Candidatus Acidiferrum sp.]
MAFTLSFIMARNGNRDLAKATNRALGKRLAQLRKMRGYSQRELARRVGAVQVVISDYEHGKLRLSAEMALRFATALDIPVQELLHVSKPVAVEPMHRPSRRLLRRMEQIERLPRRKQAALLTTIDAFLNSATGRATS